MRKGTVLHKYLSVFLIMAILMSPIVCLGCKKKVPDAFHVSPDQGRYVPFESNLDMQSRYNEKVDRQADYCERILLGEDLAVLFVQDKKVYYACFSGSDKTKDILHEIQVTGEIHKFGRLHGRNTFLVSSILDSEYNVDYSVAVLNEMGNVIMSTTVPELHNKLLSCVNIGGDENIILCDGETLFYLDKSLKVSKKISFKETTICSFALNEKNEIALIMEASNNNENAGYILRTCSDSGKTLSEQEIYVTNRFSQIFGQESGMKESFFVNTSLLSGRVTSAGEWIEQDMYHSISGVASNQEEYTATYGTFISWMEDVISLEDGRYLFCGLMMIMDSQKSGIFSLEYKKNNDEREEVTIGIIESLEWSYIESLADYYNLIQDRFRIRIVNYLDKGNNTIELRQTASAQILSDIYSGKGPDMFFISPMLSNTLAERGELLDMKSWTNNVSWPKEYFYPCIYEEMWRDGAMYMFSPVFSVYMIAGDSKVISDLSQNCDMDYMTSLARSTGYAMQGGIMQLYYPRIFTVMTDKSAIDKVSVIEECLSTCSLIETEGLTKSNNRQYSFSRFLEINGFCSFGQEAAYFQNILTPLLFPDMDYSSYFTFEKVLSVSRDCKNTEAAKELLFLMADPLVQDCICERFGGIPIRKDCVRNDVEKNVEVIYNPKTSGIYGDNDGFVTYMISDPEECISIYYQLLEECNHFLMFDEQFINILYEEYSAMRVRPSEVHEIAEVLESRLRLYVEENYEVDNT
ncbi:MAG: hypothetical protein IKX68_01750 [Clostridiales bacterium]|nr:hypothetical protein [Clostridiales bacterium]